MLFYRSCLQYREAVLHIDQVPLRDEEEIPHLDDSKGGKSRGREKGKKNTNYSLGFEAEEAFFSSPPLAASFWSPIFFPDPINPCFLL